MLRIYWECHGRPDRLSSSAQPPGFDPTWNLTAKRDSGLRVGISGLWGCRARNDTSALLGEAWMNSAEIIEASEKDDEGITSVRHLGSWGGKAEN